MSLTSAPGDKSTLLRETIRSRLLAGRYARRVPGERDLAREFGVNVKTANKAVSALVAEGILQRRRGEGTFVNPKAASRFRRRTKTISYLAHCSRDALLAGGYYLEIFRGVEEVFAGKNVQLDLITREVGGDKLGPPPEDVVREETRGTIAVGIMNDAYLAAMAAASSRLVLVDYWSPAQLLDSVTVESVMASYQTTRWLLEHGRERVAFLGGLRGGARKVDPDSYDRLKGYRMALDQSPIAYDEQLVCFESVDEPGGAALVDELCERRGSRSLPDAIVCFSDSQARGAANALEGRGISVPEEVTIVGFGGRYMVREHPRTYIDISVDARSLGRIAGDRMLTLLSGDAADAEPVHLTVPGRFSVVCEPEG